jgi:3-hydroxy-9,10-secoandrosta-1,3,5(10)-triene-9,17-dione monooxygenase
MAAAGLFKVLQPQRWGGYEMDPRVFYRVQMALAEGCMATAWIYGVIGVHNWQLPLFPEQAQQDVWGQDPTTLIASTYMPTGKAEKVDGGYRFSGRWSWSSGVEHCEWIFLGGLLPKKDGSASTGALHLPAAEEGLPGGAQLRRAGPARHRQPRHRGRGRLRARAPHPPHQRPQRRRLPGPRHQPGLAVQDPLHAGVPARGLDGLHRCTRRRGRRTSASAPRRHVGKHGSKTAEDPNAQLAVAEAMMASDQLKLVLFRNYARIVDCAQTGERMPVEERLLQRAQAAAVPKICCRAGQRADARLRRQRVYRSNPLERIFRDMHVARGHIANNTDHFARLHTAR